MLELSPPALTTSGVAVLAAITVTSGGFFLTRVAAARVPVTPFQAAFFRAGHAHAGVLIILGLVSLVLTDATTLTGGWAWLARTGALVAAILMPAGFFLSAAGPGRERPNRWRVLIPFGAVALGAGVVTLGLGLLGV